MQTNILFIDSNLNSLVGSMFWAVYKDYLKRAKREDRGVYQQVSIVGVESLDDGSFGVTRNTDNGHIHIQVVDPFMLSDGEPLSTFDLKYFVELLAHEMVHAMQFITETSEDPAVVRIQGIEVLAPEDSYFFDKHEVEAYVLDSYYGYMFGEPIIQYGENI